MNVNEYQRWMWINASRECELIYLWIRNMSLNVNKYIPWIKTYLLNVNKCISEYINNSIECEWI